MTEKTVNTTIEILGKFYPIRCEESEISSLQEAALLLNQKMHEVKDAGKVINLERIAIITALNIAHQLIQLDSRVNERITRLHDLLDSSMEKPEAAELMFSIG